MFSKIRSVVSYEHFVGAEKQAAIIGDISSICIMILTVWVFLDMMF